MSLIGGGGGCLYVNKCGAKLKIENYAVFETTLKHYRGEIEPAVAFFKIHDSGSSCRVGFIRSTEYGGMDICTEWISNQVFRIGFVY